MVCSGCDKSKYLKTAGEIWPRQTRTSEGLEPFISTRKPCKEITTVFNQRTMKRSFPGRNIETGCTQYILGNVDMAVKSRLVTQMHSKFLVLLQ